MGLGAATPDNVVTNAHLSALMDTNDEWIQARTGIAARRLGSTTSELAIASARAAVEQAGIDPHRIDQIVLATTTPDYIMPGTAPAVAAALDIQCGAFDVQAVCSGWTYAMVVANGLLHQGMETVLVIGADCMEQITDYHDRGTGILFGNGAAAAVVQRHTAAQGELLGFDLGSNGVHTHILYSEHGQTMHMDGKEVFRQAVTVMERSTRAALDRAGLSVSDIDHVFPHQANLRIIEAAWKRLGFSLEQTGLVLDRTGNTSSASVPLALIDAVQRGVVADGDHLLFLGFGAGMTWGSNIVRWHGPDTPRSTRWIDVPVTEAKVMGHRASDLSEGDIHD